MSTEWQDRNEEVLAVAADARLSTDGWWRVNCPFCVMHSGREDRRTSLGIHKDGGYHCFRCHTSGKLNPVPDWIGEGFDEAAPQESTDGPKVFDRPTGYVPLWREPGLTSVVLEPARKYLLGRGIPQSTWDGACIGACSGGWFGQRIVVPILRWGEDSVDWLGFVGRLWRKARGDETNYRYPKGMSRELFYEQRRLYEESDEPAIVVEGVFDALPYFGQGVACLGKPTKWQQAELRNARRPVALVLDGDAWEEGMAVAMSLRLDGVRAGYVQLPPSEDPNSVDPEWVRAAARKCVDY